jgi:hypothetical protein
MWPCCIDDMLFDCGVWLVFAATIMCGLFVALLIMSEFSLYISADITDHMAVDRSIGNMPVYIKLNVSFPNLNCQRTCPRLARIARTRQQHANSPVSSSDLEFQVQSIKGNGQTSSDIQEKDNGRGCTIYGSLRTEKVVEGEAHMSMPDTLWIRWEAC